MEFTFIDWDLWLTNAVQYHKSIVQYVYKYSICTVYSKPGKIQNMISIECVLFTHHDKSKVIIMRQKSFLEKTQAI